VKRLNSVSGDTGLLSGDRSIYRAGDPRSRKSVNRSLVASFIHRRFPKAGGSARALLRSRVKRGGDGLLALAGLCVSGLGGDPLKRNTKGKKKTNRRPFSPGPAGPLYEGSAAFSKGVRSKVRDT